MPERLWVRCPECATPFEAGLQVDRATFAALMVYEGYECPRCGGRHHYEAHDHWYQLSVEEPGRDTPVLKWPSTGPTGPSA